MEIQCKNKCGNLTIEGSEFCKDCKMDSIREHTQGLIRKDLLLD